MTTGYKYDFKKIAAEADVDWVIKYLNIQIIRTDASKAQHTCRCLFCDDRMGINWELKRFQSFKCGARGDMIHLIERAKGVSNYEAAKILVERNSSNSTAPSGTVPATGTVKTVPKPVFDFDAYAAKLDPEHPALEPLGIAPDTLRAWKAGYCTSGLNRGRLALPVHDNAGAVQAYIGRAVGDEQPTLKFPNGFDPTAYIFGSHKVTAGELFLVSDPLKVLSAAEYGTYNVIAFLTQGITAQQLESLASLMDERKAEIVELY